MNKRFLTVAKLSLTLLAGLSGDFSTRSWRVGATSTVSRLWLAATAIAGKAVAGSSHLRSAALTIHRRLATSTRAIRSLNKLERCLSPKSKMPR